MSPKPSKLNESHTEKTVKIHESSHTESPAKLLSWLPPNRSSETTVSIGALKTVVTTSLTGISMRTAVESRKVTVRKTSRDYADLLSASSKARAYPM